MESDLLKAAKARPLSPARKLLNNVLLTVIGIAFVAVCMAQLRIL